MTRIVAHDQDTQGLVATVRRLAVARTLSEVMDIATHAARTLLKADGISFVLREGDQCYYADEDAITPLWKGRRFPLRACISGLCMERARPVVIRDIYKDPRIPLDLYRPTFVYSLAMVPVGQDRPIAALGAYWSRRHEARADEVELLQTIADAAALAIALVDLRDEKHPRFTRRLAALKEAAASGSAAFGRSIAWAWRPFSRKADVASIVPGRSLRPWEGFMTGLGFTVAAWVVRAALEPLLGPEVPYAAFSAAVLLAAFSGGRTAGLTAAALGGFAANLSFVGRFGAPELEGRHLWALLAFWGLSLAIVQIAQAMRRALRQEAESNARLEVVGEELRHRIRNLIAVAQALARQTGRGATDVKEFERRFGQRLQALAEAQGLLASNGAQSVPMAELVERVLAPFDVEGRISWNEGPDVELDEQLALSLVLVFSELATNATKYGALSVPGGHVDLGWRREVGLVRMCWTERDGPAVEPTLMSGFGHRLLKAALAPNRGGVRLTLDPKGVQCEIEFTVENEARGVERSVA